MDIFKNPSWILLLWLSSFWIASAENKWTPEMSFDQVVSLAKKGSAYHMGLLGIYLRSGEAGCSVNLEAARKWSEAALRKGHPFGSYNLANLAMLKGDFSEATTLYQDAAFLLQRQASDGDPVAMYCMGEIDFQVIPTNVSRALELFQKSAAAGYAQAQATIGALYLKGLPGLLEREPGKGVNLLSEAARSKSLTARFNLGMAYYNGDGVKQDSEKAVQWLQVAERQNFAEAQYILGVMTAEGTNGVPKNITKASTLLSKAAEQDHKLAQKYLEKMKSLKLSASRERLEPEKKQFPKYKSEPSKKKTLLEARKYYTGIGRPRDYGIAFSMLLPLAREGSPEASRLVGMMKLTGKGTTKDSKEAKEWFLQAANNGDGLAQRLLDQYKSLF